MDGTVLLVLLGALGFVPAVGYAVWLRNQEQHEREPMMAVLGCVLYGATAGVALAFAFGGVLRAALGLAGIPLAGLLAAVAAAPVIEETAKALGLPIVRRQLDELEDGIIYGTAIGLGFAATETLLYVRDALATSGASLAVETVAMRSVSSLLLHATACGLVGFGYGRARLAGRGFGAVLPFLVGAMALHAAYNALVALDPNYGFVANVGLVLGLSTALRGHLRRLDRATNSGRQASAEDRET